MNCKSVGLLPRRFESGTCHRLMSHPSTRRNCARGRRLGARCPCGGRMRLWSGTVAINPKVIAWPERADMRREPPRTLGAEEEFHLVDLKTRRLTARAPELLAELSDVYVAELQRCVVETNTRVVDSLDA